MLTTRSGPGTDRIELKHKRGNRRHNVTTSPRTRSTTDSSHMIEYVRDPLGELADFRLPENPGWSPRAFRCAGRWPPWEARVVGHGVLVHGHMRPAESRVGILCP